MERPLLGLSFETKGELLEADRGWDVQPLIDGSFLDVSCSMDLKKREDILHLS